MNISFVQQASDSIVSSSMSSGELILAIVTGVTASIMASWIFLVIMRSLNLWIKISPYIVEYEDDIGDGKTKSEYYFKIVNLSPFKVYDVHLELKMIVQSMNVAIGGNNVTSEPIKLKRDHLSVIFGNPIFYGQNSRARNCRLIQIEGDVRELLERDKDHLELILIGKHSISGFSKIKIRRYLTVDGDLKRGKFIHGPKFGVAKQE